LGILEREGQRRMKYRFKQAETEQEFTQIARLNHAVFAAELGQHETRAENAIVDKFHEKNTYLMALDGENLAGMIAMHFEPPFSVAEKLADASVLHCLGRIAEIRLLAVDPAFRKGVVVAGLFWFVIEYCRDRDTLVISGRVEEEKMYRNLGFHPLGPAVPSGSAMFVPMSAAIPECAKIAAPWDRKFRTDSSVA
jgi:hypothetical protein